ncbi:ABC transporter substrate-binding protein [Nesterenkonia halobia]|uniref:ABC transporter substrate-binding protein n=1 Tax=Nesterenkonia halobia TaxID=37922 RepID=A0ABP6RGY9_9MICC
MTPEIDRRRLLGLASAAGTLALGSRLAGGSGGSDASAAAHPGSQPSPASQQSGDAEEAVVVAGVSAVRSMDPALAVDTETERVCRQVYESLLGVDLDTGETTALLARDWSVSGDGLTYEFRLREDVTFHDGTALDADVVVANIRRWGRLDALYGAGTLSRTVTTPFVAVFGGFLGEDACALESVEAADATTVTLTLSDPIVDLPQALTMAPFGIASAETLDDDDPDLVARRPTGTGAYRVVEIDDEQARLEAHEDHWDGAPQVPAVTVRTLPRAFDRLRELQRGAVDVYDYITADTLRPLVQSGRLILQRDPFSVLYLGFNLDHPVMSDVRIREAVAHAVDRDSLVQQHFLEGSRATRQFIPAALDVQSDDAERREHSRSAAEELLAEAGYDGEPLPFYYPMNATRSYLPQPEAIFAALAADLAAVGLRIEPRPVPWDDGYLDTMLGDEQRAMHLLGRNGGYRSPHSFFGPLFQQTGPEFRYDSAEVRDMLREARSTLDDEERADLYRQVAEHLAEDLPALPLVHPISGLALGGDVSDYPMSPVLIEPFREITLS